MNFVCYKYVEKCKKNNKEVKHIPTYKIVCMNNIDVYAQNRIKKDNKIYEINMQMYKSEMKWSPDMVR